MECKIVNTNIRLNLAREEDRRTYAYLRGMDRKKYRSYSRAVVAAINAFFGQEQEAASDKASEALFQQIENLIEQNTKVLLEALQGKETMTRVIPDAVSDNKHERTEQDQQTALDFLDGF